MAKKKKSKKCMTRDVWCDVLGWRWTLSDSRIYIRGKSHYKTKASARRAALKVAKKLGMETRELN